MKYYEYQNNGVVDIYSGEVDADKQPLNSSPWPPGHDPKTQDAYWDGCGWVVGKKFESISNELLRASAIAMLRRKLTVEMRRINIDESPDEIATYPQQYAEATLFEATGKLGPMLTRLAEVRDMEPADLVARIMTNVNTYGQLTAQAIGEYRNAVDALPEKPILTMEMLKASNLLR